VSRRIVSRIAKKYGNPRTGKFKLIAILISVSVGSAIATYYVESNMLTTVTSEALVFSIFLNILNLVAGPSSTRGLLITSVFLGILIGSIAALVV
jgi:hypothetical protein